MTTNARGDRGDREYRATERHFDRLYDRLDELSARVGKLERHLGIGIGGLGTVAIFNLISNLSNMAGQ